MVDFTSPGSCADAITSSEEKYYAGCNFILPQSHANTLPEELDKKTQKEQLNKTQAHLQVQFAPVQADGLHGSSRCQQDGAPRSLIDPP